METIYGFLFIIMMHESFTLPIIFISPSSNVVQGVRVNISCSSDRKGGMLRWLHNNVEVGEDNRPYVQEGFEIQSVMNRYDLIIRNATLKHRGKWSCKHIEGPDQEVTLNVSVPWTLKAIKVKKVIDKKIKKLLNRNNSYDLIETGHKNFPYNLLSNETLFVSCESECGLPPPKSISIQYVNSTSNGELSGGRQISVACNNDKELQMLTHTMSINCRANGLVGRNEIMCQSQARDGNMLSNKPIFVLCSSYRNVNELTQGEMIAIAVSMVLAVFDTVIIVMLLKQNCRQSSNLSQSKTDIIRCPEVML